MLDQETLKKYLNYDPDTGVLTWKVSRGRVKAGEVAGSLNKGGYRMIRLLDTKYYAHRLAWLYVHGEFPEDHTDHINGVKDDNRIVNLRAVTEVENGKNLPIRKDNTSGLPGVYWSKRDQTWQVRVQTKHYGYFQSKFEAAARSFSVYKELGFHPNHGRPAND